MDMIEAWAASTALSALALGLTTARWWLDRRRRMWADYTRRERIDGHLRHLDRMEKKLLGEVTRLAQLYGPDDPLMDPVVRKWRGRPPLTGKTRGYEPGDEPRFDLLEEAKSLQRLREDICFLGGVPPAPRQGTRPEDFAPRPGLSTGRPPLPEGQSRST